MSFTEESSAPKVKRKKDWQRVMLPLIGLIMVATAAAVAWALSDIAYQFLLTNVPSIPDNPQLKLVVGGAIFLIIIMIYSVIYAAIAPKPQKAVTEAEMDREKQQKLKEDLRRKKRRREMRRKMRSRDRNQ